MSNNTFWICVWVLIATTVISIFTLMALFSRNSNEMYYKAQTECVSSGGSWVPMANGSAMCLRK